MLFVAVVHGHVDAARRLLVDGQADPNIAETKFSSTPLIQAAWEGNMSMVRLLIRAGADVNATEADGGTALMTASVQGHARVTRYLLREARADASLLDINGVSALHLAAGKGRVSVVRELVDCERYTQHLRLSTAGEAGAECGADVGGAGAEALSEARSEARWTPRELLQASLGVARVWGDGERVVERVPRWTDQCFAALRELRRGGVLKEALKEVLKEVLKEAKWSRWLISWCA